MEQKKLFRLACETLGFTQVELARILKVSPNTVARWSRGEREMSAVTRAAIEALLKDAEDTSLDDGNLRDGWSRILDTDFQRLANELIQLEYPELRYHPSCPFMGRDGGWDGGTSDGSVKVSVKFSDQKRRDAMKYLKDSLRAELKVAQGEKVTRFIFVTNVKLTLEQIQTLTALNKSKKLSLEIWNREEVIQRSKHYRWLLATFFGLPQIPRFVPGYHYVSENKPIYPCVGFESAVDELISLTESHYLYRIVYGPGSRGKSRLMLEVIEKLIRNKSPWLPWVVRDGDFQSLAESIQKELDFSRGKYLLIVDDAHGLSKEAKMLVDAAAANPANLKILFFANTSNLDALKRSIEKRPNVLGDFRIPDLSREDLGKIFLNASGGKAPSRVEKIVTDLDGNLFLITDYGKRIGSGASQFSMKDLLENVKTDLVQQCKVVIELPTNQVELLLTELVLVAPIPRLDLKGASKIHEAIAKTVGLDNNEYQACLTKLIDAGILRERGNYLYFQDRWIAYLFLETKVNGTLGEEFCKNAVTRWMEVAPERVLKNLANSRLDANADSVVAVVQGLLDEWMRNVRDTSFVQRKRRLSFLESVAGLVPLHSLSLVKSYLKEPTNVVEEELKLFGIEEQPPSLDNIGSIVRSCARMREYGLKVLAFLQEVSRFDLKSRYSNNGVAELVKSTIKFHLPDAETTCMMVDFLKSSWVDMFVESFPILTASILPFEDSFEVSIRISQVVVPDTPAVRKVRNHVLTAALDILVNQSTPKNVKRELISKMQHIGDRLAHFPTKPELPLKQVITEERGKILESLKDYIPSLTLDDRDDFALLAQVEKLLVDWWSYRRFDRNTLETLLRTLPRSALYVAYCCFERSDLIIPEINHFLSSSGYNKPKWIQENANAWNSDAAFFAPVVSMIRSQYTDVASISDFLRRLSGVIGENNSSSALLIEALFANAIDELEAVREAPHFESLNSNIKGTILKVIGRSNTRALDDWWKKLLKEDEAADGDQIFKFLVTLMEITIPEETKILYLKGLSDCKSLLIQQELVTRSHAIIKNNKQLLLPLLDRFLDYSDRTIEYQLGFFLARFVEKGVMIHESALVKIRHLLGTTKKLEYQHKVMIKISCTDFESLFSVLKSRLNLERENIEGFEGIPYGGMDVIAQLLTSEEQGIEIYRYCYAQVLAEPIYMKYPVEYLLSSVHYKTFDDTDIPLLHRVIAKKLSIEPYSANHNEIWWLLGLTKVNETNVHLYLKALELAVSSNLLEDIKSDFWFALIPSSYGGAIGQTPAYLTAGCKILDKMCEGLVNIDLEVFLRSVKKSLEEDIESHRRRDEDFLTAN